MQEDVSQSSSGYDGSYQDRAPPPPPPPPPSGKSSRSRGRRQVAESAMEDYSESSVRLQVNVALNEDLTCSYKQSKMTSCSVEGVIQVREIDNVSLHSRLDGNNLSFDLCMLC